MFFVFLGGKLRILIFGRIIVSTFLKDFYYQIISEKIGRSLGWIRIWFLFVGRILSIPEKKQSSPLDTKEEPRC